MNMLDPAQKLKQLEFNTKFMNSPKDQIEIVVKGSLYKLYRNDELIKYGDTGSENPWEWVDLLNKIKDMV